MNDLLRQSPDFRHPGALADALLNPRERAYTVPQVFEYLERCEMVFGRWYRQAPYLPQCGILAKTPHAARLANLPPQEQNAAVELFRGTVTSHSFTAYRDDYLGELPTVHFDGDAWPAYVPIRQSNLIWVEKRLPPGAAAVLINQDHVDTDLIHPINPLEKRLFDQINGHRTILDIINRERSPIESTRKFFERLWQYDHVVFDISNTT
jgi:hypothetical protein